MMSNQVISFGVETKNGVVTKIGKSYIRLPKVNFGGGSIKWLDDRRTEKCEKN